MITVPYIDFAAQFREERDELLAAVEKVLAKGDFILGGEVEAFEKNFAAFCGVRHAVSVANGTDALILALEALSIGPGDEVITAPNSFIASAAAIALVGARPVFVDVTDDQNIDPALIERAITPRTKALMPVHLTGRCADMTPILEIAARRKLPVIEDASQSVGAKYRGKVSGSFGEMGCFSLHPLKNLNAAGDAGVITTSDDALAAKLKLQRNHGLRNRDEVTFWGRNSRLDTIQAAILNVRLRRLDAVIRRRREIAQKYRAGLSHLVHCPDEKPHEFHSHHLFVIQCDRRDDLQAFLRDRGIDSKVHYPVPIHLQDAARSLGHKRGDFPVCELQAGRILSLPVHNHLSNMQIDAVIDAVKAFHS